MLRCEVPLVSSEGKVKPLELIQWEPRSRKRRIDSIDGPPTVLSGPDRLPSHREAALLLAHLERYYTKPCREGTCWANLSLTLKGREKTFIDRWPRQSVCSNIMLAIRDLMYFCLYIWYESSENWKWVSTTAKSDELWLPERHFFLFHNTNSNIFLSFLSIVKTESLSFRL